MVQLLNRFFIVLFLVLSGFVYAQNSDDIYRPKDYKDKDEFEKFYRRRKIVGNWQINQLKKGALVVRLKTNKILVDALLKQGDEKTAEQKRLEMAAININTVKSYMRSYTFSKVYFIYSHSSDSLLRGVRKNIFLDTNLNVDPAITMTEDFYLIAERDYAYNSSIGFVKEDSARYEVEKGNPVKEMAIVVKNKYGHQLKNPFPYRTSDKIDLKKKAGYVAYISIGGSVVPFNIGSDLNKKNLISYKSKGHNLTLSLPKYFTFDKLSVAIQNFNNELGAYYQASPPIEKDRIPEEVKLFLY